LSTATFAKKTTSKLTVLLACMIMLLAATAANVVAAGKIEYYAGNRAVTGNIAGVVKDSVSNDFVDGATVKAYNDTDVLKGTTTTNAQGAYTFTGLVVGEYNLTFSHVDYDPFNLVDIVVQDTQTTTADVMLQPLPSTISGVLIDGMTFAPVMDAEVTLHVGPMTQDYVTNQTGEFTFSTTARIVSVTVRDVFGYENYDSGPMGVGIHEDVVMKGPMLMRTIVTLSGVITGSGPQADVVVTLIGPSSEYSTTTNAAGEYHFDVQWGRYTLVAVKEGFFAYSQQIDVFTGVANTNNFAVSRTPEQNAEVFGYVKDKDSNMPIDFAMVCFTDTELGGQLCMRTASDGYFWFSIYPGYFQVDITTQNYKGLKTYASISKGEVKNMGDQLMTVMPIMDKALSGTVKSGVDPVIGASVSLYDAGVMVAGPAMTDVAGYYSLMTYAGTFTAKVTAPGYFDLSVGNIVVTVDMTKDFSMTMIPMMKDTIYGYVKGTDGKPIPNAMVGVVDTTAGHGGYTIDVTTSTGGYYNFNIYDGSFLFIVDAEGFNAAIDTIVVSGNLAQDMTLDTSGPETMKSGIIFDGWDQIMMGMEIHVVNDVKLVRYMIDAQYGNGDLSVSAAEAAAWLAVELAKGPSIKDTGDLMYVDGTDYELVDNTFMVTAEGVEGDIMASDAIVMMKGANFTSMVPIASMKNHTVKYNASFDTAFTDMSTEITVPVGWEARHIEAEYVTVSGTFTVSLNPPMEKTGLSNEEVLLTVAGNSAPSADAGKNRTVKVNVNQTFDASGSDDDFGISNYTWNFGDGQTGYGVNLKHKFALPTGEDKHNYTVTVTVKDTAGVINSTNIWVLVDGAPPVANFVADPLNLTVVEDKGKMFFNASTTTDNVLPVASYTWDFDDGKFGTGMAVNHTWTQPGEYNVTLNVTDKAGWWANRTVLITVLDNTTPRALITFNGDSVIYKEEMSTKKPVVNGSRSTDNVKIVSYEWDFNDGSTKVTGTDISKSEVNHSYEKLGKFNITLKVFDAAGKSNVSDPVVIEVKEKPKIPDLKVDSIKVENAAGFKLSASDIHDGDKVKITVVIRNDGDGAIDASSANKDFSIQFTYGTHKITMKRTLTVAAHSSVTVTAYWNKAKQGKFKICAEADPENRIGETNENNNKMCTKTYEITYSWMILGGIIGAVVAIFVLGGLGWYFSKKASEERKEKLRQRKKIR